MNRQTEKSPDHLDYEKILGSTNSRGQTEQSTYTARSARLSKILVSTDSGMNNPKKHPPDLTRSGTNINKSEIRHQLHPN
jgi:hypothetical protein